MDTQRVESALGSLPASPIRLTTAAQLMLLSSAHTPSRGRGSKKSVGTRSSSVRASRPPVLSGRSRITAPAPPTGQQQQSAPPSTQPAAPRPPQAPVMAPPPPRGVSAHVAPGRNSRRMQDEAMVILSAAAALSASPRSSSAPLPSDATPAARPSHKRTFTGLQTITPPVDIHASDASPSPSSLSSSLSPSLSSQENKNPSAAVTSPVSSPSTDSQTSTTSSTLRFTPIGAAPISIVCSRSPRNQPPGTPASTTDLEGLTKRFKVVIKTTEEMTPRPQVRTVLAYTF